MVDQTLSPPGPNGPVISAEVTGLAALCGRVASGMGCALLPEMAVRAHVDRGEVVARHRCDGRMAATLPTMGIVAIPPSVGHFPEQATTIGWPRRGRSA